MSDFVRYQLTDGTSVVFEAAESGALTSLHNGEPEVADGGRLAERLKGLAAVAGEVARSVKDTATPDEVSVELGVMVAGEVNWWFFAKNQAEATIKVTLTWQRSTPT